MDFTTLLGDADALIVVPPFAGVDRPSLGAHVLQACAQEAGFQVRVLYANLVLAAKIGEVAYEGVCYAPTTDLVGERFFARTAYGVPPFGTGAVLKQASFEKGPAGAEMDLVKLTSLESEMDSWVEEVAAAILAHSFKVIGCTSTFEQTAASLALLRAIKRRRPEVVTILGGANCDGEMAEGILSLNGAVDYVFSGECETCFPEFLKAATAGHLPEERVVAGQPCFDLDTIPPPDFAEFYEQLSHFLPESLLIQSDNIWLPYEGSRGCWWGEKHHCTFCGINGSTMKFREKSPDRVINELRLQLSKHPTKKVCMVDNIMPHSYFRTLIPRLNEEVPGAHLFYEQKANLSLDQVVALRQSGVAVIQPGIEALSTSLLKRMDKGVTARQNVALLRYARAADLGLNWNLLYAFPGDSVEEYEQTLALVRLLRHLNPPDGPCHLSIDRFSPYFFAPEKYGVTNLRPMASYNSVLPSHAEVNKIAYHFMGDYESGSARNSPVIKELSQELAEWRAIWRDTEKPLPVLGVSPLSDDAFLLLDSRGLEQTDEIQFLTRAQAALVLAGARVGSDVDVEWALDRKLVVELDGWYVPLATATPQLINEFEAQWRPVRSSVRAVLPVISSQAQVH